MPPRLAVLLGLLASLLVAGHFGVNRIDAPFDQSHQGVNGGVYASVGRNYERYGFDTLRGAMSPEAGPVVDTPLVYLTHPPVTGWTVWFSFLAFGEGEWQTRLPQALWSVLAAGLAFALAFEVLQRLDLGVAVRAALAASAAIAMAASPLVAFYSNMIDPQGAGVLAGVLGMLWAAAVRQRRLAAEPELAGRVPLDVLGWIVVGGSVDWPAHYAAGYLAAWMWWRRDRRGALWVLGTAVAIGLLWIAHGFWVQQVQPKAVDLFFGLRNRSGALGYTDDTDAPFTAAGLVARLWEHHREGALLLVGVGGLLGVGALLGRLLRSPRPGAETLLLILPLAGITHVALFLQGAYVHDYWQIYLVAGLALPVVWFLGVVATRRPRLAVASALLLAAHGLWSGHDRVQEHWESLEPLGDVREAGAFLAERCRPERLLAITAPMSQSLDYYADRKIFRVPPGATPEQFLAGWVNVAPLVDGLVIPTSQRPAMREFLAAARLEGPQELPLAGLEFWATPR